MLSHVPMLHLSSWLSEHSSVGRTHFVHPFVGGGYLVVTASR